MSGYSNTLLATILGGGLWVGDYYRRALKEAHNYSRDDLQTLDLDFAYIKWKFIAGYFLLGISFFLIVILNKSTTIYSCSGKKKKG